MLEVFVDDLNGVFDATEPGLVFTDGKLEVDPKKIYEDETTPSDKRTMNLVKGIANDIEPMIKLTIDVPSNYEDGKVPMLDTKVWMGCDGQLNYVCYQKPMRNRRIILKSSAMPYRQKLTVLTQEVFRRLHNTKQDLPEVIKNYILSNFIEDLKMSGFNKRLDLIHLKKSNIKQR